MVKQQVLVRLNLDLRARNKMAETQIAIFDTPAEAIAALRELQREGVPRSAITVMSSEPLHIENSDAPKSRIAGFAIAGGLFGAAFAILLTVLTSRKVGLVTGGMPIVTPWAFGIIVFELAALGAILATLVRMVFEAKLARRGALAHYDQAVAEGRIVLTVECTDDQRNAAENVLRLNRKPAAIDPLDI
jgi:ActD protein